LLQHHKVPDCVFIITVAHELVHYAHGFGSPLPQLYRHPHANEVVERELEQRELGEQLLCCNQWIGSEWYAFYEEQMRNGWMGTRPARRHRHKSIP
jgi:hypothetical protein